MFDFSAVDQRIQNLIAKDRLPNVSVCVKGPEGTVFEKAYGIRSIESHDPVMDLDMEAMPKTVSSFTGS